MAVDHGVTEPALRYDQRASFDSLHPVEMRSAEAALEERRSRAFPKTFSYPHVLRFRSRAPSPSSLGTLPLL